MNWPSLSIAGIFRRAKTNFRQGRPTAQTVGGFKQDLLNEASRRVLFEALERRQLLSADLNPIAGSIDVPGETDRYVFTLAEAQKLSFDGEAPDPALTWSLTGPRGVEVVDRSLDNSAGAESGATGHILDLVAGDYTLSVSGAADTTGTYKFRLLDLAHGIPVEVDTAVSGQLDAGASTSRYAEAPSPGANIAVSSASTLARLAFVANRGQFDTDTDFVATGESYGLALSPDQWVLALTSASGSRAIVQMNVLGGAPSAAASGYERLPGVTNYAYGEDPSEWITGVPSFGRVHYAQVYDGIDLEYYGARGDFEYDWLVAPGADPGAIALQFSGASGLDLDEHGNLIIHTVAGDLVQKAPVIYQEIDGQRVPIGGRYLIKDGGIVGFEVGDYDASRPLTIDPVLDYASYLGGSQQDRADGIATDKDGSTYVIGTTQSAAITGQSTGAVGGFSRAFLTKYTPTGQIEYTTLLGPASRIDATAFAYSRGQAIAVGPDDSPYVVFETVEGQSMPLAGGGIAPLPTPHSLHVTKLSSEGVPVFDAVQSRFTATGFGTFQSFNGIGAGRIAVDGEGAAYVSFESIHPNGTVFPFLEKVTSSGSVDFTRQLLVSPSDIAVDAEKNIYLTTTTASTELPVTLGAFQADKKPGQRSDVYVAKLDPTASSLLAATYLGGADYDIAGGLALNPARPGLVYLSGATASSDFPVNAPFQSHNPGAAAGDLAWNGFVTMLDLTKMEVVGSTYLGGSGLDVLSDIAVDQTSHVYVVGETNSLDFHLTNPIQTEPGQGSPLVNIGRPYDFVVTEFAADLSKIEFSTYLGGSGHDSDSRFAPDLAGTIGGPRVAVGPDGTIHVAGTSASADFPVQGATAGTYSGEGDAVVMAISQRAALTGRGIRAEVGRPFSGIVADFTSPRPNASPFDFTATIDWGDGTQSSGTVTRRNISSIDFHVVGTHQYDSPGAYPVVVRVTDTKTGQSPQTTLNVGGVPGVQFEPAIAVDPNAPALLFTAAVDETGLKNVRAGTGGGLFVSTSNDGGRTWSPRRIAVEASGQPLPAAQGDPKAVFDEFGNLFLTYLGAARNNIILALSNDSGLTFRKVGEFSPPGSPSGSSVPLSVDQPSVAVGAGSVWITYADTFNHTVVAAGAPVTGPDQVGALTQFTIPGAEGGFGDIAIGPNGEVVVLWQDAPNSKTPPLQVFTSVDPDGLGGPAPFSAARLLATTSTPTTPFAFMPFQGIDSEFNFAWDHTLGEMGRLYVVYTEPTPPAGNPGDLSDIDIYLRYSDDAGATWQAPVKVSDGPAGSFQFLPSIAIDIRSGNVGVGWYDTRTGNGVEAEYFVATSQDQGASFSSGQRVSIGPSNAALMDPAVFGSRGKGYGDYSTLVFHNGVLHPAWADNSLGLLGIPDRPQLDIATAAIGVIDVRAAPPAIDPLPIQAREGQPYDGLVASFTVPGDTAVPADFRATIHWGDGTSSQGTISQPGGAGTDFLVIGNHTYAETGSYPVLVEVHDQRTGIVALPVSNISSQQGSQAETTIAIDPTNRNRVFAAAVDAADQVREGIPVAVSNDAGVTWQPRILADGTDGLPLGHGDPKAVFDHFGNLYLTYIARQPVSEIVVLLSTDGGEHFQLLTKFTEEKADQPSIAVGPGQNGQGDSVWLTWERGEDFQFIRAAGAPVLGLGQVGEFGVHTVAPLSPDGSFRNFGDIAVGPVGQVVLSYAKGDADQLIGPSEIVIHLDPDGIGPEPFGPPIAPSIPTRIGSDAPIPPQTARPIDNEGNLAWDLSDGEHRGRLYLVYTDSPSDPVDGKFTDTNIFLRHSDDNGLTWSAPVQVHNSDTNSQFLPSVAVDRASGNVAVAWYSAVAGNVATEFKAALSDDGGATFRPAYTVSPGDSNATDPNLDVGGKGFQYGDYTGVSFVNGIIQPSWADNSVELSANPDRRFDTANARIAVAEVLREPLAVQGVAVTGVEGSFLSVPVARFTDPNGQADLSRYSAKIDWGDGTTSDGTIFEDTGGGFTVFGDHEYKAFGHYTAGVEVKGPRTQGEATTTAEIENAPLSLQIPAFLRVVRETEFTKVVATLTDANPHSKAADFIATIEWGDGSASVATLSLAGTPGTFDLSGTHKYLSEGTFSINVSVLERASGQVIAKSADLVSGDPPLVVKPGNFLDIEALPRINTGDLELVVFELPDDVEVPLQTTAGEYIATINWGDGFVDENIVPFVTSEDVTVVGRHTYDNVGQFFASVSLRDDSGNFFFVNLLASVEPDVSAQVRVVSSGLVYDPTGEHYVGELNITNIGSFDLNGPFYVLFENIPAGVELVNVETTTGEGDPVIKIDQSRLLSGNSLPPIPLLFSNPDGVPITYTVKVFDGLRPDPLADAGLVFEPNRGQAGGAVEYVALGADYAIGLAADHAALLLRGNAESSGAAALMEWVGGNGASTLRPVDPLPGVSNYITEGGSITGVPHYGRVHYDSVYDGIDLEYYGREGRLEYDWIVRPGADVSAIAMRFRGVDQITADSAGNLLLRIDGGELIQRAPVAYQLIGGERRSVATRFEMRPDGSIGFAIEDYDRSATLIIDPVLLYSTYLGGSGFVFIGSADAAEAVAVDAQGNSYVTGSTISPDFPTVDAFDDDLNEPETRLQITHDAFITKFDPNGSVIFSTYLGGGNVDPSFGTVGRAIAVDGAGHVFVGGGTDSPIFPTLNPTPLPAGLPGADGGGFLTELSADGSTLLYSTVFRGHGDIGDLALDHSGAVYATFIGVARPFAFKLDTAQNLVSWHRTLLFGGQAEGGIAVDDLGQAYIAGTTTSPGFEPKNALFPTLPEFPGDPAFTRHGFVAKLSATGEVMFATLLGGSGQDFVGDIALDRAGDIYVGGTSTSPDIPVPGGFDTSHNSSGPGSIASDTFIVKLANDGSQLLYGTYLGGNSEDTLSGLGVDALGRIYVAGTTRSSDLPTVHAIQPDFAVQDFGRFDGFVAAFAADGASLDYLTYFGGDGDDLISAMAVDASGNATIAGRTGSELDFPIRNAFQNRPFFVDAFVARLAPGNAGTITLRNSAIQATEGTEFDGLVASFTTNGVETPDQFSAMIDWGDGTASAGTIAGNFRTGFQVFGRHLYTEIGEHDVLVTLRDSLGRPVTALSTDRGTDQESARYHVVIDTSSLAGTAGLLSFQFNPAAIPGALDAQARISALALSGGTLGGVTTEGGATIGPGGEAVLSPLAALNRLTQTVGLGTTIEFDLELSGAAITAPQNGAFSDVFAVQLFAADGTTPLLAADTTGSLLRVELEPNGATVARPSEAAVTAAAFGQAKVVNAPLDVDLVPFTVQEGLAFAGTVATFTTGNPLETAADFQVSIDWADGSAPTSGEVAFDGTHFVVAGTHTYLRAGRYPFSVTITEPDGGVTTSVSAALVDPVQASFSTPTDPAPTAGVNTILTTADFNRDGKLDTITTGFGRISVWLGNGDFSFDPAITHTITNQFIAGAAAADFNGDGVTDLAIAGDRLGRLEILLGNGDGTFTSGPVGPSVVDQPFGLETGDFDGDGRADLVLSYSGASVIRTLLGNGDGTFQAPVAHNVGFGTNRTRVADLNGDGRSDLVVGVTGFTSVGVILGGAGGTFSGVSTVNVEASLSNLAFAVGDVGSDGIPDIVVGGGDIVVLAGNGDGTFSTPVHSPTLVAPLRLVLGDLDRDGRADIVVGEALPGGTSRLAVLRARPGGGFDLDEPILGPSLGTIGLADWNNDGNLDLANFNDQLRIYPGRGDGTLQVARLELGGQQQRTVLTQDVNGDGFVDLVTGGPSGVVVSLGDGTGTYEDRLQLPAPASARAVATADLNRDGRMDLVGASDAGLIVSLQIADDTYAAPVNYGGGLVGEVVTGDLNGDGAPDIVARSGELVFTLMNNGAGAFVAGPSFNPGSGPASLLLRDLDGDAKADLAMTLTGTFDSATGRFINAGVAVAKGNGDGSFGPAAIYAAGTSVSGLPGSLSQRRVAAGDFNSDGFVDLVAVATGNQFGLGGLFVLLGTAGGTFQSGFTAFTSLPNLQVLPSVAVADFNRDGRLDLAVSQSFTTVVNRHDDVLIMLGNGDGTFGAPAALEGASSAGEILTGDLNSDSFADLIVGELSVDATRSGLNVLLGNGDGTFGARSTYFAGNPLSFSLADMNGDGNLDVAAADLQGRLLAVVSGRGDGTLRAPLLTRIHEMVPVIQSGTIFALAPADINRDGRMDLIATYGQHSSGGDELGILIGNGDGTFQVRPPVIIPNYGAHPDGPRAWDVTAADINDDGQPELLVGSRANGRLVTVPVNADGTLGVPVARTDFSGGLPLFVYGDFDGDGRTDAARIGQGIFQSEQTTVTVLRSQPDLTFTAGPTSTFTGATSGVSQRGIEVAAADLDRDGHLDLAISSNFFAGSQQTGKVMVLLGIGDGSFRPPSIYADGVPVGPLTATDFDGDQDVDLVGVHGLSDRARGVIFLENDGSGGFGAFKTYDANPIGFLTDIAAADLAQDGIPDIVISSFDYVRIIDVRPTLGATVTNGILAVTGGTLNPVTGVAFTAVVAALSDSNPLSTAAEYSATIDWGDGSSSAGVVSADGQGGFQVTGSHTYATSGLKTFTVRVNDDEGASASATGVADVTATVAGIAASPVSFNAIEDTPFEGVVATFTDTDPNGSVNDFTASIDWGDGESSSGRIVASGPGAFSVVGRHAYANPGSFSVPVSINDISGASASTVSTAAVAPHVNVAPVAVRDDYLVQEDTTLTATAGQGVLANDSDPDGDPLTAVLVDGPAHGDLTLNSDGSFAYRPATDFSGNDSFSYRAADAGATSDLAVVTITVRPVNDPPLAVNDSAVTGEDTPVVIDVLANDRDVDGTINPASVVFTGQPGHGTVRADAATGAISYTPDPNFFGSDSVRYRVRDNNGVLSNEAVVSITVAAQNDAPVAVRDSYVLSEDTPLVVAAAQGLLANDSDVDGDALSALLVSAPAHGTLTLGSDGSFNYVPAADFGGSDSFRYRASDGIDTSGPVTVSLIVQPLGDPPAIAAIADQRIGEGSSIAVAGGFNDPDPDDVWTATVDFGDGSGAQPLALVGRAFVLNHSYVESGEYLVTTSVSDQTGRIGTTSFNVVVDNLPASVAAGGDRTASEGTLVQVAATFADPGAADTHTATIDWGDGTGSQLVQVNEAGGTGTFLASHVYADEAVYVVTVTVTDDEGAVGSDAFAVTVTNAAPQVDGGPDRIVDEGEIVSLPALIPFDLSDPSFGTIDRLSGSFTDGGALDTHTATIDWGDGTADAGSVFERPFESSGFTAGTSGAVLATHRYGDDGSYAVSVSATDNDAGVGVDNFTITVRNVAPSVDAGPDRQVALGTPVTVTASFADPGLLDTHTAMIDWGDGTVEQAAVEPGTGGVHGTHVYAANGSYTVVVTLTDDDGGIGADSLLVSVSAGNAPPVANDDAATTAEDTPVAIDVLANDTDADGNSLTAALVEGPAHGTVILNAGGGFTYTPSANYHGADSFTYKASDGSLDSGIALVNLTITPVNDAPVAAPIADQSSSEDTPWTFTVPEATFADVDGDALTYTATLASGDLLPGWLAFDGATRTFSGTPPLNLHGSIGLTVSASDGEFIASSTFSLIVTPVNDPPVAMNDSATTDQNTALIVSAANGVLVNDTDPDQGDSKTVVAVNGSAALVGVPTALASGALLTVNADGSYTYDPSGAFIGLAAGASAEDSFTYTIADAADERSAAAVTITVTGLNDAPALGAVTDRSVQEGDLLSLALVATDPDDGDVLTYSLVGGPAGAQVDPSTGLFTWTAFDGPATQTATVAVSDRAGMTSERSFSIVVADVPPSLTASGPASGFVGESYSLALSAVDPGQDAIQFWSIDWGDGTTETILGNPDRAAHVFTEAGTYVIRVSAMNEDGSFAGSAPTVVVESRLSDFLVVEQFTPTATGFTVRFNHAFDPSTFNLYSAADAPMGAPDVLLVGEKVGAISGSIVLDDDLQGFTFNRTGAIRQHTNAHASPESLLRHSHHDDDRDDDDRDHDDHDHDHDCPPPGSSHLPVGGILPFDRYHVRLVSGSNAIHDLRAGLDGNRDRTPGDDFTATFDIRSVGSGIISIDDFMRGPGQAVNAPATDEHLPVTFSSLGGAKSIVFTVDYDPALLTVTEADLGSDLPKGATLTFETAATADGKMQARISISSPKALANGTRHIASLIASVPADAPYGATQIVHVAVETINGASASVTSDDAVHVVGYFGDADGDANYSAHDVDRIARVASGQDSGFSAWRLIDPVIIVDFNASGKVTAFDAQMLQKEISGKDQREIPAIPQEPGHHLVVKSFTPTDTGFKVRFNHAFDASSLNLISTGDWPTRAPDVILVGDKVGRISGSLVLDADGRGFTFVRTSSFDADGKWHASSGLLPIDRYRVTLVSGNNAFHDAFGALDGNKDGTPGDNFTASFEVKALPSTVIGIGDISRGPGESVAEEDCRADNGLPVTFTSLGGVKSMVFVVDYDPALLTISGAKLGDDVSRHARIDVQKLTLDDGKARVSISITSSKALPAGTIELASLVASVPKSAPYGKAELLHVAVESINGAAAAAASDDGVHVGGKLGDANGDRRHTSKDAELIRHVAAKPGSGFAAWPLIDPLIVGDVNGSGKVTEAAAGRSKHKHGFDRRPLINFAEKLADHRLGAHW